MRKNIDALKIAQLAGVSRATVSRVVNSYAFVKAETRKRVLEIIEQYAYSPNFSAQILAGKKSNTIGLFHVINDPIGSRSRLEDTHVNFIIERVINTVMLAGFYVLVYQVRDTERFEEKKKICDMFNQSRIDAGIFIGFPNTCTLIEELIAHGFIVGIFNQHRDDKAEANRVVVRLDYSGIIEQVKYAVGLGHKDIMFIGSDMIRQSGVDIFCIFREGMKMQGLSAKEEFILSASAFTKTHAVEVFSTFMEKGSALPSCIICGNDIMALGVMEVLQEHNIRVPDDVSIIGSDDILVSRYFNPPLTTMRYDFDGMIKTLSSKVVECIDHPFTTQFVQTYSGEMVIRNSCTAAASF
ncbi:MAG: LacI family transcriptional regulator [Spirochaetaceae bacterium]|jgi:LacI family transcriptional regulator|nr:LacI family transcriptional regulator [Spirochaetaceae bacterium]